MPVARAIAQRGDEVARQVARHELMFDQMQDHVVEQCRDEFIALIRRNAHSSRLVPEKRSIENE